MTTSEHTDRIADALAHAQGQMKNAALSKTNPHFRNRYADLAAIRDAVTPALTAHGIAVVQTFDASGDGHAFVLTRLLHTSGQWIESLCPIPLAADMQKMGSAITYARRYSLSAICGIAADEDDDANEASPDPPERAEASLPASWQPFKAPAPVKPEHYDQQWMKLDAAAEEGTKVLDAAFAAMSAEFKNYTVAHNKAAHAALRARSKAVTVKP